MRNLWVLLFVGLLATSSSGVINIKLAADNPYISTGQSTRIRVLAQGTDAGIASVAGNITALGTPDLLTSNTDSLAWVYAFSSDGTFAPQLGTPGASGGWAGFGSMQSITLSNPVMDPTYGKNSFVEVANYLVTATSNTGLVSLSFSKAAVLGFKPAETNESVVIGTLTPVTLEVNVPEPMTLSLLALGGLLVARRRSR